MYLIFKYNFEFFSSSPRLIEIHAKYVAPFRYFTANCKRPSPSPLRIGIPLHDITITNRGTRTPRADINIVHFISRRERSVNHLQQSGWLFSFHFNYFCTPKLYLQFRSMNKVCVLYLHHVNVASAALVGVCTSGRDRETEPREHRTEERGIISLRCVSFNNTFSVNKHEWNELFV